MVPQISQIKLGLFFIQLLIVSWTEIVNSQVIGSANDTIVFAFCTTSFTREKVPGTCKPLVKCVRFFHEIEEVKNRPCTLKTGETGVCCPYFNLPKRPSKYQIAILSFHNDTYRKIASSNTSRLEAHLGFFRLLMKGLFGPYVL